MANKYTYPGQFILKEISLVLSDGSVVDLSNIMTNLQYTESLFSNYMYGAMSFYDSMDMIQSLGLCGEEQIIFRFTTMEEMEEVKRVFSVYEITPSEEINSEYVNVTIKFVSPEVLNEASSLISKSYKQVKISDIASDVISFTGTNKPLNVDQTAGVANVIIPNWSPFKSINWLASVALPSDYAGSMYLFYENNNGFNFKHIESLIEQPPKYKYRKKQSGLEDDFLFNILSHRVINGSKNTLKSIPLGMYKTQVVAYDNVSKSIKSFEYDYDEQFDKTKHLHKNKIFTDSYPYDENPHRQVLIQTKSFRNSNEGSVKKELSSLMRSSLMSQLVSKKIEINTYGFSLLTVGDVIDMELPNTSTVGDIGKQSHRYFKKNFLVSEIEHNFSRREYAQRIVVLDDSSADTLTVKG